MSELREQLLKKAAEGTPYETIELPELGGTFRVYTMSGTDRDAFELSSYDETALTRVNRSNITARMVVFTLYDTEGKRLFHDGDIEAVGKLNSRLLRKIFAVAIRLNPLGDEDVDELAKNSDGGQSAGSPAA